MTTVSEFSSEFLNLQNDFCCDASNQAKLIRWLSCTPGIYQGSKTVFQSDELKLCSWYQNIDSYTIQTISLDPGEIVTASIDAQFLMLKVTWEKNDNLLESEKIIELGINKQGGYVGMTIPFQIGPADPVDYNYLVIKDLFMLSSVSNVTPSIKLNNITDYEATVAVFAAKLDA